MVQCDQQVTKFIHKGICLPQVKQVKDPSILPIQLLMGNHDYRHFLRYVFFLSHCLSHHTNDKQQQTTEFPLQKLSNGS